MAKANNYLPSAAFKINGVFLEDSVSGYHTLSAKGKWTLEKELITAETSIKSGSIFMNSRYPAREIEIEYFLDGSGWDSLQTAYTALMRYLDTENAEVIFNGEPDKYLRGYFVIGADIDTTAWTRHGTFKIVCPDPFKYSTTEYEQTAAGGQFSVTYNGTYRGYPTFVTTFPETLNTSGDNTSTNECGYVGFVDQREHVLQFGDPNETDWGDVTYPATVPVNRTFKTVTGWTQNNSQVHTGTQVGTVASNGSGAYPSSYGTGTGWHGPSLSYIITGESTPISKDFNCTCSHKYLGTKAQFGGFEILLWNKNGGTRTLVSGIRIEKQTKNTNCRVFLYVYSTANKKYYDVPCSSIGATSMKKIGSKVTFTVGGQTNTFAAPEIADLVANEITFHFTIKGTQTGLGANIVYNVKLQRLPFKNYEDIANIFAPGDVLTVNTQDAGVYLDDGSATVPAAYLGALGNDWEDFYLVPGSNTIAVDYSSFTSTSPTFKMKYRERYL